MSATVYYRCPAGTCLHTEAFDPAHTTDAPAVPASSDVAHDRMVEHLAAVHQVPQGELGPLMSSAAVVPVKPVPPLWQLHAMWGGEGL